MASSINAQSDATVGTFTLIKYNNVIKMQITINTCKRILNEHL